MLTILFVLTLNAYPFMSAVRPGRFAAKIAGTTLLVNAVGWMFYRSRRAVAASHACGGGNPSEPI
ncbi:MAG: hypothetical protein KGO22_09055 [Gammaproteobacteria bacterium]|nr:hypothetical protein [Gammaproteobacteria bacterium]